VGDGETEIKTVIYEIPTPAMGVYHLTVSIDGLTAAQYKQRLANRRDGTAHEGLIIMRNYGNDLIYSHLSTYTASMRQNDDLKIVAQMYDQSVAFEGQPLPGSLVCSRLCFPALFGAFCAGFHAWLGSPFGNGGVACSVSMVGKPQALRDVVSKAELEVFYPDGTIHFFQMHDDGLHADGDADVRAIDTLLLHSRAHPWAWWVG
jgi:hypothetical protein